MKIVFDVPYGDGPHGQGFTDEVEMSAPPHIGENVQINNTSYKVRGVDWYPWGEETSEEPFVYVALRSFQSLGIGGLD